MDIVRVFDQNLRRYRKSIGLSQEAFAEKCGLHRTYIGSIECFRRSISLENIQRIADALEIESYKLLIELSSNAETPNYLAAATLWQASRRGDWGLHR